MHHAELRGVSSPCDPAGFYLVICFPKLPFCPGNLLGPWKPSGHQPLDPGSIFKGSMSLLRSLQCLLSYRASSYRLPALGGFVSLLQHSRGDRPASAACTRSVHQQDTQPSTGLTWVSFGSCRRTSQPKGFSQMGLKMVYLNSGMQSLRCGAQGEERCSALLPSSCASAGGCGILGASGPLLGSNQSAKWTVPPPSAHPCLQKQQQKKNNSFLFQIFRS